MQYTQNIRNLSLRGIVIAATIAIFAMLAFGLDAQAKRPDRTENAYPPATVDPIVPKEGAVISWPMFE